MLQIFKKQQYANNFAAMEQKPFEKRESLKCQKSKENYILITFITVIVLFCSYTTKGQMPVSINSYSNRENLPSKKIALLVCNDENIPKYDLKKLDIERYIKKTLEQKNYTFTSDNDSANIVIFYEYGISDPKEYTTQKIVPVWGEIGISSSTTTTYRSIGGNLHTRTRYNPSYGQIGERVEEEKHTSYMKWANIAAFDTDFYRQTGEDKMLWLVEISNEDSSNDIRFIFPYMMAATTEYIEKNSIKKITKTIKRWDKFVLFLTDNIVVKISFNKSTSRRKGESHVVTVYEDVYQDGKLFIKAGTTVEFLRKKETRYKGGYYYLYEFSTTSVYGDKVSLELVSEDGNSANIIFLNDYLMLYLNSFL
jgi:hypothetical protein